MLPEKEPVSLDNFVTSLFHSRWLKLKVWRISQYWWRDLHEELICLYPLPPVCFLCNAGSSFNCLRSITIRIWSNVVTLEQVKLFWSCVLKSLYSAFVGTTEWYRNATDEWDCCIWGNDWKSGLIVCLMQTLFSWELLLVCRSTC
jgi:hypothetical protein